MRRSFESIFCVGVDGESGADFFHQISSPVVTGGEFEATRALSPSRASYSIRMSGTESFLEPPEAHAVRQRDVLLGRSPARTALREIVVEALLHLTVENDAEISASLPLDLLCGLLM